MSCPVRDAIQRIREDPSHVLDGASDQGDAPDTTFAISVATISQARATLAPTLANARKTLIKMPHGSMHQYALDRISQLSIMRDIAGLKQVSDAHNTRAIESFYQNAPNAPNACTFRTFDAELGTEPLSIYEYFCAFIRSITRAGDVLQPIVEPPKLSPERLCDQYSNDGDLASTMRAIARNIEEQLSVLHEVAYIEQWCIRTMRTITSRPSIN